MDTLNDHAVRISARIEEYRTLDLIGRNSADDLQHHLRALVAERDEARELANTYSAALSMVEDCLADAAGDDTSINDIRQSLGLPARDDMLPAPGDTAGER